MCLSMCVLRQYLFGRQPFFDFFYGLQKGYPPPLSSAVKLYYNIYLQNQNKVTAEGGMQIILQNFALLQGGSEKHKGYERKKLIS